MMSVLIALMIYPIAVLIVALTGPHSQYERDQLDGQDDLFR